MKISFKKELRENSPLLFLAPILIYYLWCLNHDWIPSSDSAIYITLGKSLITGQGYTYMGYTHVRYPFLFPAILASIIGLFGRNYFWMRLMVILMGVGSLGLVFLLFKRILDWRWGMVLMLLTGVSEFYHCYCHYILSDIPYLFFSLLALWHFMRNPEQSSRRSVLISAVLLLAAYFTRSVGIVLFAAVFLFRLIEIRAGITRTVLLALIFILPSGLWSYRNRSVPVENQFPVNRGESINYFDEFFTRNPADKTKEYIGLGDISKRIWQNIKYYRERVADLIISRSLTSLYWTRLLPVLLLIGFLRCWFTRRTVIEYYTLLYVLAYLLWPAHQGSRFYVPIFPFLLYYLFSGIGVVVEVGGRWIKCSDMQRMRMRKGAMAMVILLLFGIHLMDNWELGGFLHRRDYYGGRVEHLLSSIEWISRNTRPKDILVSDRAPWIYLLSGRETYGYARVEDNAEVLRSILEKKPDYIIASRITGYGRYLLRVVDGYPHLFNEVYRKKTSVVYQVLGKR